MLRSTAQAWRLALVLSMLSAGYLGLAQARGGQQGGNQPAPNPQDQAVRMAGQPANPELSGKPLDEQKSAPIQVIPRAYDIQALSREPKMPETVFRGRILWVQKCAYCHDGLGQPTYKTMGPWIDRDMVKALTDDGTKTFIQSGTPRMPAFKYSLGPSQVDDLMNFLKTVPASDKPTAAQLAGRGGEGGSD